MAHALPLGAVAAAVLVVPGVAVAGARAWQPPLLGPIVVVRPFARPLGPYGAGHRGVDLAAAPGSVVRAAGAGTVAFAGPVGGRAVVVVRHGATTSTEYEPVAPLVLVGAGVAAGAPVGVLQPPAGHCGATSCLHWGLRRAGRYEDPMSLLRAPNAPVLLPFLDRPIPGAESGWATQTAATQAEARGAGVARQPARPAGRVRRLVVAGGAATGGGLAVAAAPALGRVIRRARPAAR
ncbi:MAG TPA: peptidoglycan DD-metalloendopeptidase family protein [Sporichthyaceae bacterium]|jgi:murein DD-endopeptidase MepM/ murein hydrolase activator NlpD|nr:peptidoglycan DD-metalloendopeptidase family protein [Sporichthyaceae bacterium]